MSLQRQHFLLSYLKTLSVGPAGVRTHDLPHGSPVLNQLSQPVGGKWRQVGANTCKLCHEWENARVLVYSCTRVLLYSCTRVLVYSCTRVLVYSCTRVLVYSCSRVRASLLTMTFNRPFSELL